MLTKKPLLFLLFLNLVLPLFVWGIFKYQDKMPILWKNYDGPNYLIIAKCWYDKSCIGKNFSSPLPLEYYPAHLPGYPAIIFSLNTVFNGPTAMLLATLLGNLALTVYFYKFLLLYTDPKKAFWASLMFTIFPGRFFATKLVGAPESWFVGTILASLYYYKTGKSWLSAIFLGLAQSFKSPAILLLLAFTIHAFLTKKLTKIIPHYLVVFTVVLAIFSLYKAQTGDFFAYFNSGDNRHLLPIPFQVFLSNQAWVQTIWLEEILYILALSFFGIYYLYQQYKLDITVIFTSLFTLAIVFVGHRDISRYAGPIYPFLYLAFLPAIANKYTKIVFLLLLPAVILYSLNFLNGNTGPVSDWAPYL